MSSFNQKGCHTMKMIRYKALGNKQNMSNQLLEDLTNELMSGAKS